MYRVRLASGEEAVYRGVDELALGIQSGLVTSHAEIFHPASQEWRPIVDHPEYGLAVERAAGHVATEELPALSVGERPGPIPQVYQMFSRSARELAERRRPRWHARLAVGTAGLVVVLAAAVSLIPGSQVTDEAVLPAGAVRANPEPRAAPRGSSLSEQERRALQAPYNLATRFARAREAAANALTDSAGTLGLGGLLRPSRLGSTDSLRRNLAALAALRTMIGSYRSELGALRLAYRDTATGLIDAGRWSRAEAREWRARILWPEPAASAARADSLLITLARLHGFLLAQPNRISAAAGYLPGSDSAAATYDQLRQDLQRLRASNFEQQDRPGVPFRLLVGLLGPDTLPARAGT